MMILLSHRQKKEIGGYLMGVSCASAHPASLLFPAWTGTSPESIEVSEEILPDPLGFVSVQGQ